MFGQHFQLNEQTMHIVEEIGRHMPGGFFIYQKRAPENLLYANQAVIELFGCDDLEDFKRKAEAKSRYALQGMTEELATKAAEAEVSGDYDELARVHKLHTEAIIKAKEKEWYKNRPEPNAGRGDGNQENDPFLAGLNSIPTRF